MSATTRSRRGRGAEAPHALVEKLAKELGAAAADGPPVASSIEPVLADVRDTVAGGDVAAAREIAERYVATVKRSLELARALRDGLRAIPDQAPATDARPVAVDAAQAAVRAVTDPAQQRLRWAAEYAHGLAALDLDVCRRLADERFAFRQSAPLLDELIASGTKALAAGQVEAGRGLLRFLAGTLAASAPESASESVGLAAVLVLLARLDYEAGTALDSQRARQRFRQARSLAAGHGLPDATRALAYYRTGEYGSAVTRAQRAVRLSPDRPEGYALLAMCAEAQQGPNVDALYKDAAAHALARSADPRAGLRLYIGKLPQRLLVALARGARARRRMVALECIEEALALNLPTEADSDGWLRRAGEHQLRARILVNLRRDVDAADALCSAVDALNAAGDYEEAAETAREATTRNPDLPRARWLLADALRIAADRDDPPYVDADTIHVALEEWEAGERAAVDPVPEWALWVRAALAESQARMGTDVAKWLWEAVALSESGLLDNPGSAATYAALARYLRELNRWPAALQASETALAHERDNRFALEERLILLTNTGQFDRAREVMGDLTPGPWLESVHAFQLSRTGEPERALGLVRRAMSEKGAPSIWEQMLIAHCLRLLGRNAEAAQQWAEIWEARGAARFGETMSFAWAGWRAGEAAGALALVAPLERDPIDRAEALRLIGLCELSLGAYADAAGHLRDGIKHSTGTRTLTEFRDYDLADAEALVDGEARKICAKARRWVATRLKALEGQGGAEEDLLGARAEGTASPPDWTWIGSQAALARLSAEAGDHRRAAALYAELAEHAPHFRGADIGHARAITGLRDAGDRRLAEGDPRGAAIEYADARALPGPPSEVAEYERLQLLCREAVARLEAGEPDAAGTLLERAATCTGGGAAAIAASTSAVLSGAAGLRWKVANGWAELARGAPPPLSALLHDARTLLLDGFQADFEADVFAPYAFPDVVPFQLQVAADVQSLDADVSLGELVEHAVMDAEAAFGLAIPRPEVTRSGLTSGGYRVLLDDALVASGQVDPGGVFFPMSLLGDHLTLDLARAWRDPLNGQPGVWIPGSQAATLPVAARLQALDAAGFVVRHVRAVLRDNAHVLLGIEQVERLLDGPSERVEDYPERLTRLPDEAARLRFGRLLRELAREHVPVGRRVGARYVPDPGELLAAAAASGALEAPSLREAVSALRREVRDRLPGNDGRPLVRIPSSWEAAWPPEPEDAFRMLAAIRAYGKSHPRPAALVTSDGTLRAGLRRLVAAEFPEVGVLSTDELTRPDALEDELPALYDELTGAGV